jgi:hypothetical protein
MSKRVSSTVTKRKANPRPRKYASASERQAAYRDRAPEVCFRAEPKTVETLDRIADPAPAKQRMGRIVHVDPKTGVPFGTELVPIDFAFKAYVGNYQHDFFARTEGAQLVVSEKTTGAKVGAVGFNLRSAALNDRAAAKAYIEKTVERIGADKFNDAIRKAPKLTA